MKRDVIRYLLKGPAQVWHRHEPERRLRLHAGPKTSEQMYCLERYARERRRVWARKGMRAERQTHKAAWTGIYI